MNTCAATTNYKNLLSDFNLVQHVVGPSRVTDISSTLIDHVVSTPAVSVLSVKQAIGLSDHRVQIADIDVVVQRPSATFRWLRPFRRCCWDDVRDYLSSAPWSTMEIYDDPDDMWGFFCQIVTSCLDKFVPLQKVRSKYSKRSTPWITPEVLSAIKEKQRAISVLLSCQGVVRVLLYISNSRIS